MNSQTREDMGEGERFNGDRGWSRGGVGRGGERLVNGNRRRLGGYMKQRVNRGRMRGGRGG